MCFRRLVSAIALVSCLAAFVPAHNAQAGILAAGAATAAGVSGSVGGAVGLGLVSTGMFLCSAAAFGGGIAVIVLASTGSMGLGFLGLGIPLVILASPMFLVFDEHGSDLGAELQFLTPNDMNAVKAMMAAKVQTDNPDWQRFVLDAKEVENLLERNDYSKKDTERAMAILTR